MLYLVATGVGAVASGRVPDATAPNGWRRNGEAQTYEIAKNIDLNDMPEVQ